MSLKDDIALLADVPLFADLGVEQLRLLAFGAERRTVSGGQTLFREGTDADCAYVVASGSITLSRSDRDGHALKLGVVGRGALLGEVAMVSAVKRRMNAVATEHSEVIRITRPLFTRMLEEYPEIAVTMRRRIADGLKRMIADLQTVAPRFSD